MNMIRLVSKARQPRMDVFLPMSDSSREWLLVSQKPVQAFPASLLTEDFALPLNGIYEAVVCCDRRSRLATDS